MKKIQASKMTLFKTFLYKYILVDRNEEEKKNMSKEIFLIAGLVFIFSSILIFCNIQKIKYSSVLNFVYVVIVSGVISFYKEKKHLNGKNKSLLCHSILKIFFYLLLFFSFYLIFRSH